MPPLYASRPPATRRFCGYFLPPFAPVITANRRLRFVAERPIVSIAMRPQQQPPARQSLHLTPQERLQRFVELQRRANQLLAASPEGIRRFIERNLRQRRIHAHF